MLRILASSNGREINDSLQIAIKSSSAPTDGISEIVFFRKFSFWKGSKN